MTRYRLILLFAVLIPASEAQGMGVLSSPFFLQYRILIDWSIVSQLSFFSRVIYYISFLHLSSSQLNPQLIAPRSIQVRAPKVPSRQSRRAIFGNARATGLSK